MARGTDYSIVAQSRRLEVLAAIHRLHCELDAMQTEVLAVIAADPQPYRGEPPDSGKQWAREDVACALRIPPATARHHLDIARDVVTRFPDTLDALWAARLSGRMAERLVESCTELTEKAAGEVESRVLKHCDTQTYSQFGQSVRRAVAAADTRLAEDKHAAAREQRRVVFTDLEHGMTELWALLPTDQAARLRAEVDALAESWKGPDDRTADQRRADALCVLGAGAPDATKTVVNVTVPLSTLLGLDDAPGELDDHGPIPASVARRLAFGPDTVWRRLLLDPHGNLTDASAATYRPPVAMTRFVQLRDRTCQFPGCRRRATRCELDHLDPWLRSKNTSPQNLICLCSRHHHLKHEAGWTIHRDSDLATHWTNPAGQTHTRPPPEPPPF